MEKELVVVLKTIDVDSDNALVVANPDQEGAAICVQEGGDGLQ
jgi:hypothetical protein